MNKPSIFLRSCCLLLSSAILSGCATSTLPEQPKSNQTQTSESKPNKANPPDPSWQYEVRPENFSISFLTADGYIPAAAGTARTVSQLEETETETKWRYPEEHVSVSVKPVDNYLSVTISADTTADQSFTWPEISAGNYYFPFGEGKRVPAEDPVWGAYLDNQEFSVMEQLSMPFWAAADDDYAVVFIMETPFRSSLNFTADSSVSFSVSHEYPAIDENRVNRYRIYLTDNEPASIAKVYRSYVMEQGDFVTLEQKAAENPNIRKLYGAPFIYLWGDFILSPEDINWPAFRASISSPVMNYLLSFPVATESRADFETVMAEIKTQDYVGEYQKNVICRYLSELLKRNDFYNPQAFPASSPDLDHLLKKGKDQWNESEQIQVNKYALAANLPEVWNDVDTWMGNHTTELISQLKAAGIDQAWIGLHGWEQAMAKPELVKTADDQGYLIASYDSYHSIHEPGKEKWSTAAFEDSALYETATVTDKHGEKISGFQGVGRKLNPVLSIPAVKSRMSRIMGLSMPFSSWFIDCDATGEIYDDYSPEHVTTQQEDLAARLERMALIRDTWNLVIGSEGGNDFAASTIAFAHGIELKTFSWMDDDMKKNKESDYYIGNYYSQTGGVAAHFSKRIPIKSNYYTLFVDPKYDIPLFKLVYNDSVITSYHWDWSTFKIQDATQDRMVREVLYNVPPLYHLDSNEWKQYGEDISKHHHVWSEFSRQAVTQEMTDFQLLEADGSVQMTCFGQQLRVIANFQDSPYLYNGEEIPGHSARIEQGGTVTIYTPDIAPENS